MDLVSVLGIVILAVIVLFLGQIISFLVRVVFVALLVVLVLVLFFGISLEQVVDVGTDILLMTF